MNSGLPMQFLPRIVANLNPSPPLALHYHSGTQAATPIILAYQFPGTSQRWSFGSIYSQENEIDGCFKYEVIYSLIT